VPPPTDCNRSHQFNYAVEQQNAKVVHSGVDRATADELGGGDENGPFMCSILKLVSPSRPD